MALKLLSFFYFLITINNTPNIIIEDPISLYIVIFSLKKIKEVIMIKIYTNPTVNGEINDKSNLLNNTV